MSEVAPELVERMVALVREIAAIDRLSAYGFAQDPKMIEITKGAERRRGEAREIVAALPAPIDPYLAAARELAASTIEDQGDATKGWTRPASIRKGLWDHAPEVVRIHAALCAAAAAAGPVA